MLFVRKCLFVCCWKEGSIDIDYLWLAFLEWQVLSGAQPASIKPNWFISFLKHFEWELEGAFGGWVIGGGWYEKSPVTPLHTRFLHSMCSEVFWKIVEKSPVHTLFLKGSVERSLLPWAIFLIFTQNRPWKSEDQLCILFFIEMSKERLEKSERTPPVLWRPWALAYSRDRPYNFSCLSALSKNGRFRSFFSDLGCHLAR